MMRVQGARLATLHAAERLIRTRSLLSTRRVHRGFGGSRSAQSRDDCLAKAADRGHRVLVRESHPGRLDAEVGETGDLV